MRKIKIGFLGVGHMGQLAHLYNYAQLKDYCEITTLCDLRIEQAKVLANRYGVPKVTANYREMLDDPEIEAVVCVQQFENNIVLVPDVLKAGKHVLTEKPLCVFPHTGEKLVEIARQAGKIHMVGYHKRSDPAVEYAMGIINEWKKSGEFGKLNYVRISMPPGNYRKDADKPFFTDEPKVHIPEEPRPEGMDDETRNRIIWFTNYYIHQVNLMRLLMGEDYQLTYADRFFLSCRSESGINGILEIDIYNTSIDWQEHALVCFERGWVRVDLPAPLAMQIAGTVTVYKDKGWDSSSVTPLMPNVCAMRNQAKNFCLAVAGEKPAPCLSAEAVKDLRIAEDYIAMTKLTGKKAVPYSERNKDKVL